MNWMFVSNDRSFIIGQDTGALSFQYPSNGLELDRGGIYCDGLRVTGPVRFQINGVPVENIKGNIQHDDTRAEIKWDVGDGYLKMEIIATKWPFVVFLFSANVQKPIWLKMSSSLVLVPTSFSWMQHREYRMRVVSPNEIVFNSGPVYGVIKSKGAMENIELAGIERMEYEGPLSGISFRLGFPVGRSTHVVTIGAYMDQRWLGEKATELLSSHNQIRDHPIERQVIVETSDSVFNEFFWKQVYVILNLWQSTPPVNGFIRGVPRHPWIDTFMEGWAIEAMDLIGYRVLSLAAVNTALEATAKRDIKSLGIKKGYLAGEISPWEVVYNQIVPTLMYPGIISRMIFRDPSGFDSLVKKAKALIDHGVRALKDGFVSNTVKISVPEKNTGFYMGSDIDNITLFYLAKRGGYALEEQAFLYNSLSEWLEFQRMRGKRDKKVEQAIMSLGSAIFRYYWDGAEQFFRESLTPDKKPRKARRPIGGIFPQLCNVGKEQLRAVAFRRILEPDILAEHGIRTRSNKDELYNPAHIHNGAVWSFLTALGAFAAFRVGDGNAGKNLLDILRGLYEQYGYIPEYIHGENGNIIGGDVYSAGIAGAIIQAVIRGAAGLSFRSSRLEIHPALPTDWEYIRIKNLMYGGSTIDLEIRARKVIVENHGPGKITVKTPSSIKVIGTAKAELPL